MGQQFIATSKKQEWDNGAIGYGSDSPMDCLGPFAKVSGCPISGTDLTLTCYATGYADTWFSVPACTRHKGKHVKGYFTMTETGPEFRTMDGHKHLIGLA